MSVLAFDTHRIVKRLKEAGFSDLQAETVTDVLGESRQLDLSNLSTKTDLGALKSDLLVLKSDLLALKSDLSVVKSEMQVTVSDTKADLLKWVVGAIGLQTVVVLSALVALARTLQG